MNASPSLQFDAMRATDLVGSRLTPPGFYYKTFIRPRRLWPLYERVLRHAAGLGKLPKKQAEREWHTEYRRRHADVLVIGGGIAGMAAALQAAELGADVVLVDDGPELGGSVLAGDMAGEAKELAARVAGAGVEILAPAAAIGWFDGLVPVWCGSTLHQIRAGAHITATGSIEQPLMFEGNDLPGVMLCSGAERLASLYGVRPGKRAVIATTTDRGLESALALHDAGVAVAGVADARPAGADEELAARLEREGIPLLRGTVVVRAFGRKKVKGAVVATLGSDGQPDAGTDRGIDCDLVAVSGGSVPSGSLLLQAGAKARWDEDAGAYVPGETPPGVFAAGAVAGHASPDDAEASGLLAGAEAALSLGYGDDQTRAGLAEARENLGRGDGRVRAEPPAAAHAGRGHGKCFACLCEDVTTDDIDFSIDEGFDSLELLKRYTTVTMGPCQGRMCQLASIRKMAEHKDEPLDEVGLTTARPPWSSIPMGVMAGRPFEPAKRSAVHGRHRELGGDVLWAGDWRRPYDYGDPKGETMAVHDGAGLIDVSTLGKLIVRGPDAGRFLNLLYPNRFDNLKPGRIRYGVLGDDAGRIADDGTICRLDDESLLRHHDVERGRRRRGLVRMVARRVGPRRSPHRRQPGPLGVQPCGAALAGDPLRAHRPGLLERGVHLPRRQARPHRGRSMPAPADRVRRGARLRAPLPGLTRGGPLGCPDGGGGAPRDQALRPRAAAGAPAPEDAHPGRPGHRRRVESARGGDALDREARQGGGLHRPLGAGARPGARGREQAGRLHDGQRRGADRGRRGGGQR